MKRLILLLLVMSVFLSFALVGQAQVTKIKDIQYTADASGDSPLKDQVVTISGIVTGEPYAFGGKYFFVQDSAGAWSGIKVYNSGPVAFGDSVTITGKVKEYYGLTEIGDVTELIINDSAGVVMPPVTVTTAEIGTGGAMAEAYEGVLIKVMNVAITNPDLGHGEWEIDDGSGPCRVDDAAKYYFWPADYDSAKSVTGILDYSFSNTKIEPRLALDVVETGNLTRLQRIQQVRYSDLMKAGRDSKSDMSYMFGDTVTVTGIVTMPTGLSFAGNGIKFILSDVHGGPWSAILSYNADSTAYPALFAGDSIKMTGYIGEYSTGPSNMTEFWITSPIDLLDFGKALPPVDTIATGDLRWPTTAEQWGNVIVAHKNAVVKNLTPQYELFSIDDGSGEVLVDDDSDSLSGYPDPPQGTIIESISGWVYHHYGSYADSTTYKLEPLYKTDIVLGAGPPDVRNTTRAPEVPTGSDAVIVSTDVTTNLNVASVELFYRIENNNGAFVPITMDLVSGSTYQGLIPAQTVGAFVEYFIKATDENGQTTMSPADTSLLKFGYPVTDGTLTISEIQHSPWKIADSPFEGMKVSVSGIVTCDTTLNNRLGAYSIQDAEGPWNGIFLFGAKKELYKGDAVTVHGTVTDYNADWHFKWDNNTVILLDSLTITGNGQTVPEPAVLTSYDISNDAGTVESYEGCLVRLNNVTISSINKYDVTVDDGSGPCLIDDDGLTKGSVVINQNGGYMVAWGDTLHVGDVIDFVQGVFTFSFGTYKIEMRDANDLGVVTGVNENPPAYPLSFDLEQNFPNPFNPETRINFTVPVQNHVKIVIYNSLGQIVRVLADQNFAAGRHILNWNGRNDQGALVPSGVYFYRMKAGDFISLKKMMLLK